MSQYQLATYRSPDGPRAGLIVNDVLFDLAAATGRRSYAAMPTCCATGTRRIVSSQLPPPRRPTRPRGSRCGCRPVAAGAGARRHFLRRGELHRSHDGNGEGAEPRARARSAQPGARAVAFPQGSPFPRAARKHRQASRLLQDGGLGGGIDGDDRPSRPQRHDRERDRACGRIHHRKRSLRPRLHQAASCRRHLAVQVRLAQPEMLRERLSARSLDRARRRDSRPTEPRNQALGQ